MGVFELGKLERNPLVDGPRGHAVEFGAGRLQQRLPLLGREPQNVADP